MLDGTVGKKAQWTGRIVSAIPVLLLLFSGSLKLAGGPEMAKGWDAFGYPPGALLPIGVAEIACALVYLVPRTAVLGAILVTGYLGGAVASHVRLSQPVFFAPALLGVLAWLGLFLREPRLRALLPLRGDR